MKRLTERERTWVGTGISKKPMVDDAHLKSHLTEHASMLITKLAYLEDAEEDGRLIVLPCKTVWFIADKGTEYAMVMQKPIEYLDLYEISKIDKGGRHYSTKETAELALLKMRRDNLNV